MCILVSIFIVSITLVIIASISHKFGVITGDYIMIMLQPLQMLLGEQLGSREWFAKKTSAKKKNFRRICYDETDHQGHCLKYLNCLIFV